MKAAEILVSVYYDQTGKMQLTLGSRTEDFVKCAYETGYIFKHGKMPAASFAPPPDQGYVLEGPFKIPEDISALYTGQVVAQRPLGFSEVGLDFGNGQGWLALLASFVDRA